MVLYKEALQNQDFCSGSRPEDFQNHSISIICEDFENPITQSLGKKTVLQNLL